MVPYNRTVLYRRYSTTNGTRPCNGSVPTVPTPLYRFVGQFANAGVSQIVVGQIGVSQIVVGQISVSQIGVSQIGVGQIGVGQIDVGQIGVGQIIVSLGYVMKEPRNGT
jgi:hypothetical protein